MTSFNRLCGLLLLAGFMLLSACSGEVSKDQQDSGGNTVLVVDGGALAVSDEGVLDDQFVFDVVEGMPYTVIVNSLSGDEDLSLFDQDYVDLGFGYHRSSENQGTGYDVLSFIAGYTGTWYASTLSWDNRSNYTIEVRSGHLQVDAPAHLASVDEADLYYSFDAVAGLAYRITLTPETGTADIGRVSTGADLMDFIGASHTTGQAPDVVSFVAATTGRHYFRIDTLSPVTTVKVAVTHTSIEPDLQVVIDSASSNGTDVAIAYTVVNNGLLDSSGNIHVAIWADRDTAPQNNTTPDDNFVHVGQSLAPGQSISANVVIPHFGAGGTAWAIVDRQDQIAENDESNNVSMGIFWEATILFDMEDGQIPPGDSSGSAAWFVDSTTSAGGLYSLRSGVIDGNQSSCFALTLDYKSTVSFDVAISTEQTYDILEFIIDGGVREEWSGDVAWTHYTTSVAEGIHTYQWCYRKDDNIVGGADAAWIDNIEFQ